MKRRYLILGLAVLTMLVLVLALAGPASAGTAGWQPFTATYIASVHVPPTLWPEWKGVDADGDGAPDFFPVRSIDECFAGQQDSSVAELSGYLVVRTNGIARFSADGILVIQYTNKSTLYVGASSATEGDGGRWEMTASGLYTFDMNTWEESHTVVGRGHGVSGDVKGWVTKFTGSFPGGVALSTGCYLEK
jgi:hypothetical protein